MGTDIIGTIYVFSKPFKVNLTYEEEDPEIGNSVNLV